jgi:hypothetical protein
MGAYSRDDLNVISLADDKDPFIIKIIYALGVVLGSTDFEGQRRLVEDIGNHIADGGSGKASKGS